MQVSGKLKRSILIKIKQLHALIQNDFHKYAYSILLGSVVNIDHGRWVYPFYACSSQKSPDYMAYIFVTRALFVKYLKE